MKIELGGSVREIITKAEGVVMCCTKHIDGTTTYGVQFLELIDGRPTEWITIDQGRLEVINGERIIGFKEKAC